MKRLIKPIQKPFDEIVKAVATFNPNPDKALKTMKRYALKKKKKGVKK